MALHHVQRTISEETKHLRPPFPDEGTKERYYRFAINNDCFSWLFGLLLEPMNKDEMPPAAPGSRLKRIKIASRIVQFLIAFSVLFGIYWLLAFLFHWPFFTGGKPFFNGGKISIILYGSHTYNSPGDVPSDIVPMLFVKAGWIIVIAVDLFALFQLYARGILFSARNVQFIRFFGYWLIVNWFIDQQIQSALHDSVSTTPLCAGFIIIFVAWIMDEGRKIQEEQELTV